jgi:hypothetical protein
MRGVFSIVLVLFLSLFSFSNPLHKINKLEVTNSNSKLLYYVLIPFTTEKYLIPCSKYFNEQEEFNKARQCVDRKVFTNNEMPKTITLPTCYIISKKSPDVETSKDKVFNFINFTILMKGGIVGFYLEENHSIFVVENIDDEMIYRHELQHYFLKLVEGDANAAHDHRIWQECEPPHYDPSIEAEISAKTLQSLK